MIENKKFSRTKGFTLVELMVVACIVALLSVVVMINLDNSKVRARDSQRKSDLSRVAAAFEVYKADNKVYLASSPTTSFVNMSSATQLVPNYLTAIPVDPLGNQYKYRSDGNQFKAVITSETISSGDTCAVAQQKAGEYADDCTNKKTYLQVSSNGSVITSWVSGY